MRSRDAGVLFRTPGYVEWEFYSDQPTNTVILPDGCVDIIVFSRGERVERVWATSLDFRPRQVSLRAGSKLRGFRFRPGTIVDTEALHRVSVNELIDEVEAFGCVDVDCVNATSELAAGGRLRDVARAIGVSPRTLQRRLRQRGLAPPEFWRSLGRARRAALELSGGGALVEIAAACGFSDQAHMTRELKRWFAMTPAQLRSAPEVLRSIAQPALATWTGEQISIR